MFGLAKWITVPESELKKWEILQGKMNNRFAYFILDVDMECDGNLTLLISATARYRLWINGKSVLSGPCKGDRYRQYYDEIDVSGYLVKGANRFAVQVLACDSYIVNNMMEDGQQPLIAYAGLPLGHRLAVEGQIKDSYGKIWGEVTTGVAPWKVYLEGSYVLEYQKPYLTWFGAIAERIPENAVSCHWKNVGYEKGFVDAEVWENVKVDDGNIGNGNIGVLVMKEREIPFLYEKEGHFLKELCADAKDVIQGNPDPWKNGMEVGRTIPGHTKKSFILDAGEIKTAFMKWHFSGGRGAKVGFTYAERFTNAEREIARDDYQNGVLEGMQDELILDGTELVYEPFWYRTFRFVRVEIETKEEEAYFGNPCFMETGYPIDIKSHVKSSEKWVEDVWKICVRTLERCMNETYMDCPYYEQMQFPMDTRLQALYTYLCSNDTRLARKALKDFHYSMIPDGLIQGKYPCSHTQIISTFSLHYIFMLKEYYMQTGDESLLRRYRSDVDLILDYYDRKVMDGLVSNLGYWEFVDWQPQWAHLNGAPAACEKGPSSIINLMYGYALECGAYIYEATGREGVAEEYRLRKQKICRYIKEKCWSEDKGLFREGPDFEQYSVHAQSWAVLCGLVGGGEAGTLMERALTMPDIIPCSFSTSFEIFKALSISGRYDLAQELFGLWKTLPEKGCTTCPETPRDSRSECHAWSAQPIYEFLCSVFGISIVKPGWKEIRIKPNLLFLKDIQGEVVTPRGIISFTMEKEGRKIHAHILLPKGMEASFIGADGTKRKLYAGENQFWA